MAPPHHCYGTIIRDGDDKDTMEPRVISVHRIGAHDDEAVKALAGRAFSPLGSLPFPCSPDGLIAERRKRLNSSRFNSVFGIGSSCGRHNRLSSSRSIRKIGGTS